MDDLFYLRTSKKLKVRLTMVPSHGPKCHSYMEHSLLPINMVTVTHPLQYSDKPVHNKNGIDWTTTSLDQLSIKVDVDDYQKSAAPTTIPSGTNEICKGWELRGGQ